MPFYAVYPARHGGLAALEITRRVRQFEEIDKRVAQVSGDEPSVWCGVSARTNQEAIDVARDFAGFGQAVQEYRPLPPEIVRYLSYELE